MKKLFMDLSRGISGDMFISALADAGVDFLGLERRFKLAGLDVRLDIVSEKRKGIMGKLARVSCENEQPLRTLEHIVPLIQRLDVSWDVKAGSIQAFERLAQVEAEIHGLDKKDVHFHELGAVDTLVDIVGAFWALEILGVKEVTSTPMPWFRGEADISHGLFPLPAPATSILMQGKEIRSSDFDWEIITPTGALIVDQLVSVFEYGFSGKLLAGGFGYGSIQKGFNCLRIFLWEDEYDENLVQDNVWLLESNIDHMTGEEIGYFFQKIMQAGALDVIYLQGIMKKNRPGGQLQVLCHDENFTRVQEEFFKHTLTLGIRVSRISRNVLSRKEGHVFQEGEQVKAKEAVFSGKAYCRPEMEDMIRLAEDKNLSVVEMRLKKNQL
jgi:uncharacterized protein (TIGR00299 family) protein